MNPKSIIISRTDSIGDVVLTLPMCGIIKEKFPECRIYFLSKAYTKSIVESCVHVDEYLDWDEMQKQSPGAQIAILQKTKADVIIHVFPRKEVLWLAKRARIPLRIATGRRLYTISKCNRLVFFSRKSSPLHESQLNLKLLKPIGIETEHELTDLIGYYGFSREDEKAKRVATQFLSAFDPGKKKIILHPLSKGSASDWSLENYRELVALLSPEKFDVFITGTKEEGERIHEVWHPEGKHVHDVTGRFNLAELIAFIRQCDGLVAASTGPLHIASACGIHAFGLYSPKRPIHPGRWSPVGKNAHVIVAEKHPPKGQKLSISPVEVYAVISSFL